MRSMLDGKMRSIVSGRGGAYCPQCDCTAATYFERFDGYCVPYVSFLLREPDNTLLDRGVKATLGETEA